MMKRSGFPPILCLVLMVFFQSKSCTSCSGVPSDYNSVVLTQSAQQVGPGQTVTITAEVPKDTLNEGVTWVFTPGAGAPASAGTFTPTSTTVATYTAPSSVATGFTVTITATSKAFATESATSTITVTPPQPLKVTAATLADGVVGITYSAGTTLQATGGIAPYTWTLAPGSGPLPTGLALLANGTISGSPTATGTFAFTAKVTDSEATPMTATGAFTIAVTNQMVGNYAFEFSGFNSGGSVVVAGSFTADGLGHITNGVEDLNTILGPPQPNQTLRTFTGTYTLENDNRGQIIFSSLTGSPTYDFAIDANGLHGRIVEFDTTTGIRGSGEFAQQNTSTCASTTLSGTGTLGTSFVIGVAGSTGSFTGITPGPIALAGRFTAEPPAALGAPGTIETGEVDVNAPQQVITQDQTFSGTFQTTSQAARCTMSVSQTLGSMTFSVYPVSSVAGTLTEAYVVETDTVSATTPYLTVGKLIEQFGYPFTQTNLSFSAPSIGGLSGSVIPTGDTAYFPFVAVAALTPTGGGGFTMPLVENLAGTVSSYQGSNVVSATLNTGDSFGRVDTNLVLPVAPVFYVIGPNQAFCILENTNAPVLGLFEPQSKGTATSFSAGLVAGALVAGTSAPTMSATRDFSGVNTLAATTTTTGTISGTQDTSTSGANTAGQAVTGTFALGATGATDGGGTFTLTAPGTITGQFFIVSPTSLAMITTTAGDLDPVLIFLGNCETTCGPN